METAPSSTVSRRALRKALTRLVPLMMIMYIVSYLDRVNIGFAALKMNADLGFSDLVFGIGAGLFFVGYSALEVPSNLLLHRLGARVWIARIMITWGILAAAMGFIQGEWSFYAVRLLLGIAEAGFVPGIVLYTTMWFPRRVRTRVVALFLMAIPFAVVLGAPVSALLIQYGDGLIGLSGWRFMFLAEGIPAVLLGALVLVLLPSTPREAKWLTATEKDALCAEIAAERVPGHTIESVRVALKDRRIYLVSFFAFCANMGGYSLSFFMPQIVSGFQAQFGVKFSLLQIGLITAIPFGCAAVALWINGRWADRTGDHALHLAIPLGVGSVAVGVALFLPNIIAIIAVVSVAAACSYCIIPVFWQLPTRFLAGAGVAAGMGLVAGLGNIAGFVAPYITGALKTATGGFQTGMLVVALVMATGAIVALRLRRLPEFSKLPPGSSASPDRDGDARHDGVPSIP